MPQGLRLKVTAAELRRHCSTRSAYHQAQASKKGDQVPPLRAAMDTVKASNLAQASSVSNMGGKNRPYLDEDDPVEKLEREVQYHANQALVFAFYGSHLYEEDYDLNETDLQRLQILKA